MIPPSQQVNSGCRRDETSDGGKRAKLVGTHARLHALADGHAPLRVHETHVNKRAVILSSDVCSESTEVSHGSSDDVFVQRLRLLL